MADGTIAAGAGAPGDLEDRISAVDVARMPAGARAVRDWVAREEPLEIRIQGASLAVVMRTPGDDAELGLGFLVTERVVRGAGDLVSLRHSSHAPSPEAGGNVLLAVLAEGHPLDLQAFRRNLFAASSCGVCGKATLESVLASAPPLDDPARFGAGYLAPLGGRLLGRQPAFERTGGLHAAALFAPDGELLVVREDVGRHNAVDKVVGWAAARRRLPLSGHALWVSGRVSFEIVQKALAARIPLVAAVSAPSSLAVALAERAGIAVAGFARGAGLNVYGARERVRADDAPVASGSAPASAAGP